MKYKVLIQHFGDRQYWVGESREVANEQDANELIKLGLIAPFDNSDNGNGGEQGENEKDNPPSDPKAKAKPAHKNKAETALQNKTESDLDNKDAAE